MKSRGKGFISLFLVLVLIFTGCSNDESRGTEKEDTPKEEKRTDGQKQQEKETNDDFIIPAQPQTLEHVHGIGYPGNDNSLYVASHEGIKMYKEGKWLETSSEKHDYMGFQVVEDGFYSSGHPEKGSKLKNPLGLVKSVDLGKTLEKIAFYGESDFHFMSASFQDRILYVINEKPNSELGTGIYVSKDEGKSWEQAALKGFDAQTFGMISVHPEKGGTFAMSTKDGLYISEDSGKTITEAGEYEMVTAAAFSKNALFISPIEQQELKLVKLNQDGTGPIDLPIPALAADNPITYIAADIKQDGRMAFITYQNDLYESTDGGKTWKQILVKGNIK